jgi:hypothetical protein
LVVHTPSHPGLVVHGPGVDAAIEAAGVVQKSRADGADEDFLEEVEGNVGDGEELSGIRGREANVG